MPSATSSSDTGSPDTGSSETTVSDTTTSQNTTSENTTCENTTCDTPLFEGVMFEVVVAEVDEAVARLAHCTVPAAAADIARLRTLLERLEAIVHEAEVRFDTTEAWRDDGATSLRTWLASTGGSSRREAAFEARRVDRLGRWPEVLRAWRSGVLTRADVDAMVTVVPTRFVERFAGDAAAVIEVIAPLDGRDTELALRQWVRCAESDDGPTDLRERTSGVHVATLLDQSLSISGILHGADAALVGAALRVFEVPDPVDEHGAPIGPARTSSGRTADALVAMARCALGHRDGPGDHGRFHPHVLLTIDVAEVRAAALHGAGVRTAADVARRATERGWSAIETAWFTEALRRHGEAVSSDGQVLDAGAIGALSCDSVVQRVLTNGSRVLDLGREVRTATPAQRRAVIARDRHCRAPGCRTGPRHCDVHHIDHWIEGGRTDVARMVLLCGTHHRQFHRAGHRMELDADAVFTVHSSQGWTRSTVPDRAERLHFDRSVT